MAPAPGTRLGAYEVLALLGNGGMGQVYRARDTRLDRIVAIKTLHPDAPGDPDRPQRLDREARAIASLNHPHICSLYDVGHEDGIDYLVMELLEGQTLAERLTRGALPFDEAMQCAIQLADALAFAHRHGIVHRDLKPANVFIAHREPGGATVVKLLDFGLAKATPLGPPAASGSATLTNRGTLLGTLHYMAPEQLEGRDADPRSDLFAFGAVLYEMLAGRRAFTGDSQASVIAAVLDSEPPSLSASQVRIPPELEHLVKTCLAKNPDDRWQVASDVKRQLEWIATSARLAATEPPNETRPPHQRRLTRAIGVVALMALVVVGALAWSMRTEEPTAAPRVTRTTIPTSGAAALVIRPDRSLAITPDGTRVVYIGNGGTQLFVRPTDRFEPSVIFTAVGPLNAVFLSPDGKSVGFKEGSNLKKVALTGGPAETILSGIAGNGATWAPDDTIILATRDRAAGLQRMSAAGGHLSVLTRPDSARGELTHAWPRMLPGGRAVLFTITAATGGLDAAQVAVFDLATDTYKVLVPGGSDAHYVSSQRGSTRRAEREGGHLVYVKGSTLMAIAFDPVRLETSGTPMVVLPRLATKPIGSGEFDVADDGTIVYVEPPSVGTTARTLVWVDRHGLETPLSASLLPGAYAQPRVSPDGTRVAVEINDEEHDIWVLDVVGQTPLRKLTSGSTMEFAAMWTKDSHRVIFGRPGGGLFWQAADGTGKAEPLNSDLGPAMLPSGMTPDGTLVLFFRGRDVMAMSLDDRHVEPMIQTEFNERWPAVSPNGRWLAHESDRSLRFEIYVTPFPDVKGGGPWPISTAGGIRPLWAPDGRELFFVAPDGAMMAVRVDPRGSAWSAGSPMKLFAGPYETGPLSGRNYDLSADGKRFLMVKQPAGSQATTPQIVMVQHWVEELKRLVPASR
jgi:eukaryotic-like serine/threonine-protein kinase